MKNTLIEKVKNMIKENSTAIFVEDGGKRYMVLIADDTTADVAEITNDGKCKYTGTVNLEW